MTPTEPTTPPPAEVIQLPTAPPDGPTITRRMGAHLGGLAGGECPFCRRTEWRPHAWAQLVLTAQPGAPQVIAAIPCIAVECTGCGHIAFFNAVAAGVLR